MRKIAIIVLILCVCGGQVFADEKAKGGETVASEVKAPESAVERKLFKISQGAVVGMVTTDMLTTSWYMTHPLVASYCHEAGCQNPTVVTTTFHEAGWAGVFSKDNPVPVVLVHAALATGVLYTSHKLYQKGGSWRLLAIGLNFFQATQGFSGTAHNLEARSISKRDLVPTGVYQVIRW